SIITAKMSRSGRRDSTEFLSADGASTVLLHGELPPRTTDRPTVPADALPPTQGRREEPYGHGPRAERFRSGRASGRRPRGPPAVRARGASRPTGPPPGRAGCAAGSPPAPGRARSWS